MNREDIVMKSKGEQYRSYEYVADAVSAMLLVLLRGAAGEAYNIASDISWATIHEFALTMAKAGAVNLVFDLPDDVEKQGYSVISRAILSSEKIVGLGWKPTYTLAQGIEQTMKIVSHDDNWEDE